MLIFLLLIPETIAFNQASTIIQEIARNPTYQSYEVLHQGDLPIFIPHITVMGLEGSNLSAVQKNIQQVLTHQKALRLTIDSVRTTEQYFRSVFVFFEKNKDMDQLIVHLRSSLENLPLMTIKSSNEDYIHMSLAYTSATLDHKNKIKVAPLSTQSNQVLTQIYPHGSYITANKLVLMTTEQNESPEGVRSWVIQQEYPLDDTPVNNSTTLEQNI